MKGGGGVNAWWDERSVVAHRRRSLDVLFIV